MIADTSLILLLNNTRGTFIASIIMGGIMGVFNNNIIKNVNLDPRYIVKINPDPLTFQKIFDHGWQLWGSFVMGTIGMFAGALSSVFSNIFDIIPAGEEVNNISSLLGGMISGSLNFLSMTDINLDIENKHARYVSIAMATATNTLGHLLSKPVANLR